MRLEKEAKLKQKTKEMIGLFALILLILSVAAFAWIVIKSLFLT